MSSLLEPGPLAQLMEQVRSTHPAGSWMKQAVGPSVPGGTLAEAGGAKFSFLVLGKGDLPGRSPKATK